MKNLNTMMMTSLFAGLSLVGCQSTQGTSKSDAPAAAPAPKAVEAAPAPKPVEAKPAPKATMAAPAPKPVETKPAPKPEMVTPASAPAKPAVDMKLLAKPGFHVEMGEDGRLWVFRADSKELAAFKKDGEPVKQVIRPLAGPMRLTIKGPDVETIRDYVVMKPGFFTKVAEDGRLWVFREGSKELAAFLKDGEPVKQVIRPAVGPMGMTVKGPDAETIRDYVVMKPGFYTKVAEDGRLWVFQEGSKDLAAFLKDGEPVKQVIRPAAGPMGMTLKGPDAATLDAYMSM